VDRHTVEQDTTETGIEYELYLYVSDDPLPAVSDASVVDLTPKDRSAEAVLAAIVSAGLTAADLRTRTLFLAGSGPVERAVSVYAAVCGFAGRPLDFSDLDEVTVVRSIYDPLVLPTELPRPAETPEQMVVSAADVVAGLDAAVLPAVHFAKRVALGASSSMTSTLEAFVTLAALRRRGPVEKFPHLMPADSPLPGDDFDGSLLDLDALRRAGAQLRRDRRIDDRDTVVERVAATPRSLRLVAAAALPFDGVLSRLGSVRDESTGFYRCPRPERHRNGDATPSARLSEHGFRCFRCDAETVDALRLVMDVRGLAPDAAADWLLDTAAMVDDLGD
jgi:hypothetical protein